jgi:hypothetical protein
MNTEEDNIVFVLNEYFSKKHIPKFFLIKYIKASPKQNAKKTKKLNLILNFLLKNVTIFNLKNGQENIFRNFVSHMKIFGYLHVKKLPRL